MAWLVGEGIIVYRSYKNNFTISNNKRTQLNTPPGPGQLLMTSGVFVLLALLAESERARTLAVMLAWGFDIAAFMNLTSTSTAAPTGKWPPALASNTVIIPSGTSASAASSSATASAPTTTSPTTGTGPISV